MRWKCPRLLVGIPGRTVLVRWPRLPRPSPLLEDRATRTLGQVPNGAPAVAEALTTAAAAQGIDLDDDYANDLAEWYVTEYTG